MKQDMNCSQADALIQTALDGRLSSAERAALDAHTAHCAACRTAWEEYRRLGRAATDWARRPALADDPGDAFTALVMARIARESSPVPRRSFRLPPLLGGRGGLLGPRGLLHRGGIFAGLAALAALSYWTGPMVLAHVPHVSAPSVALSVATPSLDGIGRTLGAARQDTLGAWRALTAHPAVLPAWVPGALAFTFALNAAFAWRARRPGGGAAAR